MLSQDSLSSPNSRRPRSYVVTQKTRENPIDSTLHTQRLYLVPRYPCGCCHAFWFNYPMQLG